MAGYTCEAPPPYSASQPCPDENTPLLRPPYQAAASPPPPRHPSRSRTRDLSQTRTRIRKRNRNKTYRFLLFAFLAAFLMLSLTCTGLLFLPFYTPRVHLPPLLPPPPKGSVRIAIVGAGPAGIAAAFQLSDEFKLQPDGKKVEVVIFERKRLVGGRMAVDVDLGRDMSFQPRLGIEDLAAGDLFATGSVVRGRAEKYLGMEFGKKGNAVVEKEEVGFFNGWKIVFSVTRPRNEMSWGQWSALFWRHGTSFVWAKSLPTRTMEGFGKLLNAKQAFDGIGEMVEAAGIGEAVGTSARDKLKSHGVDGLYREEVVEQQVRRQIGQRTEEISDLALSMALQREYQGLSHGGSLEDVLLQFLERSKAELRLVTEVTNVRPEYVNGHENGWILELQESGQRGTTSEAFDKVILAGSWNATLEDYYRPVWITFLTSDGELDAEYFGMKKNTLLSRILIIDTPVLPSELRGVHEISNVKDLYGPDLGVQAVHKLLRVLSDNPISEELISKICGEGILRVLQVKIRNAYPLLYPRSGVLGKFKIQDGLYRTGVVEEVASSVDLKARDFFSVWESSSNVVLTSKLVGWVAGEKVAKLVRKEIEKDGKNMPLS